MAVPIIVAAAAVLLIGRGGTFSPQVLIAVSAAFALGLVLIGVSLVAVFIEGREIAELEARLDHMEADFQRALRESEEGAAEMGLPAISNREE